MSLTLTNSELYDRISTNTECGVVLTDYLTVGPNSAVYLGRLDKNGGKMVAIKVSLVDLFRGNLKEFLFAFLRFCSKSTGSKMLAQ